MPEGDTVRRTAAGLDRALAGRELTGSELRWGALGSVSLAGRVVLGTEAYGKHLFTRLSAAPPSTGAFSDPGPTLDPLTVHSHLRMDGSWEIRRTREFGPTKANPQTRAVLITQEWTAVGRLLGMLDLVPTATDRELIAHLGPDVMADDWEDAGRAQALRRAEVHLPEPIGQVLLDQTVCAGIGTFYMAEALFGQRISPWTPAAEVDLGSTLDAARRLLLRGAQSPIPNTTGDPRRKENSYVHARSGRPCRRCGTIVRVAGVGDAPAERPAFYCPTCQPGPTPTDDGRPQRPLGASAHRPGGLRNVGLGPARWRKS